ncbi:hypothetical protein BV20DRAFT_628124 [Pilatotrama ljubarskyi]|nr:hypothetical protein BV20DRAFT_628124 [Pilatotrama ljubarskyi]
MNLHAFCLLVDSWPHGLELHPPDDSKGFRASLREFRITGPFGVLSRFIEQWAGPALQKLEIVLERMDDMLADQQEETFTNLFSLMLDGVRHLCVRIAAHSAASLSLSARIVLAPLLLKADLTEISVSFHHVSVELDDDDLAAADAAWPHLYALRIEAAHTQTYIPPTAPSLADVVRFMMGHRDLRHLALPYMITDTLADSTTVDTLDHSLETFHLTIVRIRHSYRTPLALALLFDKLLPNLDVSAGKADDKELVHGTLLKWRNVERVILALRTGRTSATTA